MRRRGDKVFIRRPVKFTTIKDYTTTSYNYDLYDLCDETEEMYCIDEKPEAEKKPEPVKKTQHYGEYNDGVVNCKACESDEEQFKCSNFRRRTNAFDCSFLFNSKDCMSIDVQQQIRDKK